MNMSKLHWLKSLMAVCTVLISGPAFAQPKNEFKITSFIPERFEDFAWMVDGQAGIDADFTKRTAETHLTTGLSQSVSRSNRTLYNVFFSTRPTYELYSRDFSLLVDLQLYLRYLHESSYSHDTTSAPLRLYTEDEHGGNANGLARLWPTIRGESYLLGDIFGGLEAIGQLSYDYSPSSDYSLEARGYYESEDGYVGNNYDMRKSESSQSGRNNWIRGIARVGLGRVYSGYYASTAIYFADELRRRGLLKGELDKDQMLALTEMIYQRRLLHAIDSREFQIETYQMLLDFAMSEGMIDSTLTASLVLQDVWRSFPGFDRRFGWKVSLGYGFALTYSSSQSTTTDIYRSLRVRFHRDSVNVVDTVSFVDESATRSYHTKSTPHQPYLVFRAEDYRPLSLKWQFDVVVEGIAYFNWYSDQRTDVSRLRTSDWYTLDVDASLRCILSSRSNITFQGFAAYEHKQESSLNEHQAVTSTRTPSQLNWSLGSRFDLRIAMPTTMRIGTAVESVTDDNVYKFSNTSQRDLRLSLSVGVTHHIY